MAPLGSTRVAAVIGHPVHHSLSPAIHNAAFRSLDLDWSYVAFDVAPGEGTAAIEAMRALHLGGMSVTMPHKAAVATAVDRTTPQAAKLGAVNCVAWDQGELVGHNTDGDGFVASLREQTARPVEGRTCVLLGAGGAARAVVLALAEAGAREVVVVNRTRSNAEAAAALAGVVGRVGVIDEVVEADLIVNATPIGMRGTPGEGVSPLPREVLHEGQIVADLVYHPRETPLLEAAAGVGAICLGGIGMLVHQAARQFELWTGHQAPLEVMAEAAASSIGTNS